MFVIEAERARRGDVEAALNLLQTCPLIMLLLNKVTAFEPQYLRSLCIQLILNFRSCGAIGPDEP